MEADAPFLPHRLRAARIRLLCTFIAAMIGELTAALLHVERLHWIFATAAFVLTVFQLTADMKRDRVGIAMFALPAFTALAVLYVMSTRQAFSPEMAGAHSHAHMVCLSSVFVQIAKYFEKSARFAATEPLSVLYETTGAETAVSKGDTVTVARGEIVPVDGTLISDETSVDESALSGDLARVKKYAGDVLYCGSINYDREVTVLALCAREDSVYLKRLSAARNNVLGKSEGPRRAGELMARIITLLFLAMLCIAATMAIFGINDAHKLLMRVIAVNLAATPAVFALLGELADKIGFASLARSGIIISAPRHLNALSKARAVAWDKSAIFDSSGNTREGLTKTRETLRDMGMTQEEGGVIVANWRAEIAEKHTVRVNLGREIEHFGDGIFLTRDRAAHLLKAIYVSVILRRRVRLGIAITAVINIAAAALAMCGILTVVYASIAAVLCAVIPAVNDRAIEKCFETITFNRVIKTCKRHR